MDCGIARAKNSVMTQTSSVLGTAHYISPEQAQGKDLTATSDIYSLGIVLYESATGRLPFDGPDAVSVAMKQVNDLPVPPREKMCIRDSAQPYPAPRPQAPAPQQYGGYNQGYAAPAPAPAPYGGYDQHDPQGQYDPAPMNVDAYGQPQQLPYVCLLYT